MKPGNIPTARSEGGKADLGVHMVSDKFEDNTPMNTEKVRDEIQRYLSLLWHWTWLIILICVVAGFGAFIISYRMTPLYETSTKVLVIASPVLQPATYNSNLNSQNLVPTYADMLTNESILAEVIKRLKLTQTTASLAKMININPVLYTSTIKISVDGPDPAQIAQIGNTLVAVFIEKIKALQSDRYTSTQGSLQKELASIDSLLQTALADEAAATDPVIKSQIDVKVLQYRSMYATVLTNYEQARLAEVQATSSVVQIDQAGSSYQLVSPKTFYNIFFASLLGLLLAAGFVLIRDALDNTIKSVDDVSHCLNLPVLGVIYRHTTNNGPVTKTDPRSPISDAFRSLRTNLQYVDVDHPIRSILVTSSISGEGKSTVSVNLAVALAQADNKVTLIDADFHHSVIHERMGFSNQRGLTTLLGRPLIILEDILQSDSVRGLSVITAGEAKPPNVTEILGSKKMAVVLGMLLNENDMVVIDAAPVLPVADARILAPLVDGVLLVVQSGVTARQTARQAVENLRQVKARIIGVVLNNVNLEMSHYDYYYGSDLADKDKVKRERLNNKDYYGVE
jgi:polysaccharide biosynthesis transport protein